MKTFDDPNVIVDIFRRRNLKPKTGCFVGDIEQGECCILSALYCDAKGCESPSECLTEIREQVATNLYGLPSSMSVADGFIAPIVGIDPEYAMALMEVWDNEDIDSDDDDPEPRRLGVAHGRAARKACEEAFGMEPLRHSPDYDDDDYDDFDDGEDDILDMEDEDDFYDWDEDEEDFDDDEEDANHEEAEDDQSH